MKTYLILAAVFIHSHCYSQYLYYGKERPKEVKRIWYLKDVGIKGNTNTCYSAIMQKVIDSAYRLPGETTLVFPDTGTYHYSLYRDFKGKKKGWIQITSPIGEMRCVTCEIKKIGYK